MSYDDWHPYISVGERRRQAAKRVARLRKSGHELAPIKIEGRKISRTFWGSAWCENLEAYSDYENRLPRGRTYARNGSVIDLRISGGQVSALVSGSEIYEVELRITKLSARKWKSIRTRCAGKIDSLVELLQGQLSDAVMNIVTQRGQGLFPTPREIELDCSCPDWATMCKHVAAVLYGVGARLDHAPELLFTLRGVDPAEMVSDAVDAATTRRKPGRSKTLADDDLSAIFGVAIVSGASGSEANVKPARRRRRSAGKPAAKKTQRTPAARRRTSATASKKRPAKKRRSKRKPTKRRPPGRRGANLLGR